RSGRRPWSSPSRCHVHLLAADVHLTVSPLVRQHLPVADRVPSDSAGRFPRNHHSHTPALAFGFQLHPRRRPPRIPPGDRPLAREGPMKIATAVVLCTLLLCAPAFAWGPDGHVIVGRIAELNLANDAKAALA